MSIKLVDSDHWSRVQEQDYSERIQYLKDNNTIFTVDGVATGEE